MDILRRAFLAWLPLAVLAAGLAGVGCVVAQQSIRAGADEPQLGLAKGAASALSSGAEPATVVRPSTSVMRRADGPFTIVTDASGAVVASDVTLNGRWLPPPPGVLAAARSGAIDRVTWQPTADVRLAQVSIGWTGGAVTVARSLAETERVEDLIAGLVAAGFAGTLVALALVSVAVAAATPRP